MTSPSASNSTLPFAAAATATTLSRLITKSATTIVLIAAHRWSAGFTSASSDSGSSSLTAIHSSKMPPVSFRNGRRSNCSATAASITRRPTATAAPQNTARFC